MNRRGFLGTCLALGAAPAIVRAASLMPGRGLIVPSTKIFTFGDSIEVAWTSAEQTFNIGVREQEVPGYQELSGFTWIKDENGMVHVDLSTAYCVPRGQGQKLPPEARPYQLGIGHVKSRA